MKSFSYNWKKRTKMQKKKMQKFLENEYLIQNRKTEICIEFVSFLCVALLFFSWTTIVALFIFVLIKCYIGVLDYNCLRQRHKTKQEPIGKFTSLSGPPYQAEAHLVKRCRITLAPRIVFFFFFFNNRESCSYPVKSGNNIFSASDPRNF